MLQQRLLAVRSPLLRDASRKGGVAPPVGGGGKGVRGESLGWGMAKA